MRSLEIIQEINWQLQNTFCLAFVFSRLFFRGDIYSNCNFFLFTQRLYKPFKVFNNRLYLKYLSVFHITRRLLTLHSSRINSQMGPKQSIMCLFIPHFINTRTNSTNYIFMMGGKRLLEKLIICSNRLTSFLLLTENIASLWTHWNFISNCLTHGVFIH